MSKDEKNKYTRRTCSRGLAKDKNGFYQRLRYKILKNHNLPHRRSVRRERFDKLNKKRVENNLNEIRLKFVWGKNPIPEDYIPIAIFPKGQIACIHKDTQGSVHDELARILFPEYKTPIIKAVASSYTLVAPIGSLITLCYGENRLSKAQAEKQKAARNKIKQTYIGKQVTYDKIDEQCLNSLNPDAKIENENERDIK